MEKELVIALITGHFILDWILQPRKMARNKSKELRYLMAHLVVNFSGLFLITWAFSAFSLWKLIQLNLLNIFTHGLIDWNIWRLAEKMLKGRRDKEIGEYLFYSTIAVDQALHLIILMVLFL